MDKLISQQASIDALCKSECGCSNAECRHKDGTDFCVTCDNVKIIKSLPSAQPEPEAISKWKKEFREYVDSLDITRDDWKGIIEYIGELPSAQPKQNEMIKEIRRWINSGNRGNADYFIVDKIEEIINAYEIN